MNEAVKMNTNGQWSARSPCRDRLDGKDLPACLLHCGHAAPTFPWSRGEVQPVNLLWTFPLEFTKKKGKGTLGTQSGLYYTPFVWHTDSIKWKFYFVFYLRIHICILHSSAYSVIVFVLKQIFLNGLTTPNKKFKTCSKIDTLKQRTTYLHILQKYSRLEIQA